MLSRVILNSADQQMAQTPLHDGLLGRSDAIREVRELVSKLAVSDITVLIMGESGTGKDIAARLLHKKSPRHGKPFIKVNCPAVPESIMESELFGHERGAFTGARTSKPGRFELANHGTLFLDEIVETPYHVQGKLLQVLDGEPIMRIGGTKPVQTDVRLLAASNVDFDDAVTSGRLREDIFFRLSEAVLRMPPLRERLEDVPLLAEHFNYNYSTRFGKEYVPIPESVLRQMCEQAWRGNVRELGARVKNFVSSSNPEDLLRERPESSVVAADAGAAASAEDGPEAATRAETPRRFPTLRQAARQAVAAAERSLIEEALKYTLWNRRRAAELLDISYSSLLRRIDTYRIGKPNTEKAE